MEHPRIIAASAIALAVTLFAIFSMRPWARRVGLVDRPDTRKQHNGRVPVIGGICFFIGTLVGLGYLGYLDRFVMSLMMGSALIVAVGVADDVVHLSVRTRLLLESALVGLVILSTGYYLDHVGGLLPTGFRHIGLLGIPLTVFAVIGLINAFNMLDGIDGLAASVAMVCIAAVLAYDPAGWAFVGVMFMLQILFAALIPYIFVNLGWPDGRKVFMGDAGSTVIGFLLGWSLIYLSHSRVGRLAPVDTLWCVAVPVMDTLGVMYRRIRLGRSPFGADRQHLHHLLIDRGLSTRATLAVIVAGGALLASFGYLLRGAPDPLNLLVFLALTAAYVFGLPRLLERGDQRFARRPARRRLGFGFLPRVTSAATEVAARPSNEDHEPYPLSRDGDDPPVRALCVFAATPEAIGVAPLARRLDGDERFQASVCLSEIAGADGDAALAMFGLRADRRLAGDLDAGAMVSGVQALLQETRPDVVVVAGDAPATFAISLAAHADDVPLVCVDADVPATASHWPNEASRRIVQSLASLHVAASESAGQRLLREDVPVERVLVQPGIAGEALRAGLDRLHLQSGIGRAAAQRFAYLRPGNALLLVTGAREPGDTALAEALEMIARRRPDVDIVWPGSDPATQVPALDALRAFANVHVLEPIDYPGWVYLFDRAHLVLTGQGAPVAVPVLTKPVLVARDGPETADQGGVAIGTTALAIAGRVLTLLSEPEVYRAMCEAIPAPPAAPGDYRNVLDALARLRGAPADPVAEFDDVRYAYGVRQAS